METANQTLYKSLRNYEDNMGSETKDWRKALRSQPAYRIVNRTIRGQTQFISIVAAVALLVLFLLYIFPGRAPKTGNVLHTFSTYNYTYPLTSPIKTQSTYTFRIGLIADLDTNSKSPTDDTWSSFFLKGYLSYSPTKRSVIITWDRNAPIKLSSGYSLKNRGMELSELVVFNGKLLSFDDRTGLIFEIMNDQVLPWLLLTDGDGRNAKGFKSEWATVKDEILYVGSMGKEWTTSSGEFEHHNPQYVKSVSVSGVISHLNWINEYKRLRETLGIHWPGYMIHESGVWSAVHRRWYFLPRRCSQYQYNETLDEHRGCSVLMSANEEMRDINVIQLPSRDSARGFSSFKFIPATEDHVIVGLRTEEVNGRTATYITAFTIDGKIILDDTHVANLKYEGIEFI